MIQVLLVILAVIAIIGYWAGTSRARSIARASYPERPHSLHRYHGIRIILLVFVPAILLLVLWSIFSPVIITDILSERFNDQLAAYNSLQQAAILNDARSIAQGFKISGSGYLRTSIATDYRELATSAEYLLLAIIIVISIAGFIYGLHLVKLKSRARTAIERFILIILMICSTMAILTTAGIVFSLFFEAFRFFQIINPFDFLFGLRWSPSSDTFGAIPLFTGTLLITAITMTVAAPVGILSAIYLSYYASPKFRALAKPLLEILAGIPTVVYGFFAALTVAPALRSFGEYVGLSVSSESALAAGVVMGIMIIPFISSLSDDIMNAVPHAMSDGSAALGATPYETIIKVIFPAALPGIISALLLAISRAIGETMIVVMAAGQAAKLTINPIESVTTVTVQIITLLTGDQEFDSAKTLAAFALGLVLFFITLSFNVIASYIVQKYREQYE